MFCEVVGTTIVRMVIVIDFIIDTGILHYCYVFPS